MAAQIEQQTKEEEKPIFNCPMLTASQIAGGLKVAEGCMREGCAWWVPQAKGCAVYVFAADIHQLTQMGNLFTTLGANPAKLKDLMQQAIRRKQLERGGDKIGKN